MANYDSGFIAGSINLDASPPVYYPGQVISGTLSFRLNQAVTFSVLNLEFLGEARVYWTETEYETVNGYRSEKNVEYNGQELYFDFTQTLAGGAGTSQFPPGTQTFPFKYQIPFNCPSSFTGELGNVTYKIIARMYSGPQPEEFIKEFQVVAPMDFNTASPELRQPIDFEFEAESNCSCFGSSPIEIRLRLPATGFCPGQVIPISVEVANQSSTEVTKMIFELYTKELYRSQQPPSENILPERVLVTSKTRPVMGKTKRNFICELTVPEFIAPYLDKCSIIDVGYFFRVTIKYSGCTDDDGDDSEICLGLVPLRELVDRYVHPMSHSLPKGPIPIDDGSTNLDVPPNGNTYGPNNSIYNVQSAPLNSAPYPGNDAPYKQGEIGFVAPVPYPNYGAPYPGNVANQGPVPPYPIPQGNVGPVPPYPVPQGNAVPPPYPVPQGNAVPPPYAPAYAPSAPPS